MNQRPSQLTRFRVMAAMALAVLAIYLVVLFNTQVVHHEEYLATQEYLDDRNAYTSVQALPLYAYESY